MNLRKHHFKKILLNLFSPYLILLFSIFYQRKYLTGRWFENTYSGFLWSLKGILWQKIFKINKDVPWPVSPFISISNPANLVFCPDDLNNFQGFGNYFQNFDGKIFIGEGTYIAPNVGIITSNHDLYDLNKHMPGKDVIIGKKCWLGMNAVILPGIELGDCTIVGAGAVVTKSFREGNCVIAGNPAKIIKKLYSELETC